MESNKDHNESPKGQKVEETSKVSPEIKKKLPLIAFILIIPLGILVGYFFSNIQGIFSEGFSDILRPVNKLFYVAKVDGVGITKGEWEENLKSRYGQNAIKELIDIYTVRNELKKAGITVSEDEIDAEITEIEKQLAGQSLEDILKQQGRSLTDFRKDINLQVGMKKLLSEKIVVSDEEVSAYVENAGDNLVGTTDQEKRDYARKILFDTKLGEEINKWFSNLQSTVKVENYLDEEVK